MFGLCGAHRAGKSTLARDVAEASDGRIKYHDASVSALMKARGIDMVAPMTPEVRLGHQQTLLELFCQNLQSAPRPSVTDRTPLDMAAYAIAEIGMNASDAGFGRKVQDYVQNCLDATRRHFDLVFIIYPLPHYEPEAGKPAPSIAYQMHIHYLIRALADEVRRDVALAGIRNPDRATRTSVVTAAIDNRLEGYATMLRDLSLN